MLQAWEASYQSYFAESWVFHVRISLLLCLTFLLFIFGQLVVTRFECCQDPATEQSLSMHVTALVMYPEHLGKANRIWQKSVPFSGWNWKCSNLLKATVRGSNSWPQLVNKPNVFTEQHWRWKRRKKNNLQILPQQIHLYYWAQM